MYLCIDHGYCKNKIVENPKEAVLTINKMILESTYDVQEKISYINSLYEQFDDYSDSISVFDDFDTLAYQIVHLSDSIIKTIKEYKEEI